MMLPRTAAVLLALASLSPWPSAADDPCWPGLGFSYDTDSTAITFEIDPVLCGIKGVLSVDARLSRDATFDGQDHRSQTTCAAVATCLVRVEIDHPTIEHAVYQGRVDYEAEWEGGFAVGGAVVISRCTSVEALAICNP